MLEQFDDSAKQAVALARGEALAGGQPIGCEHLLLALCRLGEGAGDAVLASAGLTEDVARNLLRDAGHFSGSSAQPASGEPASTESSKVAPHAGAVLYHARQQADGRNHDAVGSSHLLLAMVAAHPPAGSSAAAPSCGVSRVMDHLKAGHAALVVHAIGQVQARHGERNFPYVGAELAAALPARNRRWAQSAAIVAGYAAFAAVALALSPAGVHRTIAAFYLLTGLVLLPLLTSVASLARVRRRMSMPDAERVETPALAGALAPARLEVYLVPGGGKVAGRSLGRAFRLWGRATIILRPVLRAANPDLVRFVAAHEAAHIARGDGLNAVLAAAYATGLAAALAAGDPAGLWLLVPALAGVVVNRWTGELACDRIAARAAGRIPSLEFASYLDRVYQSKKMTPGKRLRSLVTHPPASMRRKAITRAYAVARSLVTSGSVRTVPAHSWPVTADERFTVPDGALSAASCRS